MPNKNYNDLQKDVKAENKEDIVLNPEISTKTLEKNPNTNIFDRFALNIVDLSKQVGTSGKTKEEELCDKLKSEICASINDSASFRTELVNLERIADALPDPAKENEYFTGSSNYQHPELAKSLHGKAARFMASIFGVDPLCLVELIDYEGKRKDENGNVINSREEKSERAYKIEQFFSFLFRRIMKAVDKYREIIENVLRIDTGLALIYFDEKYEKRYEDNKTYKASIEFINDFSDYKDSGLNEQEYNDIISKLDSGQEVTIPKIQKNVCVYKYPKLDSIERDKFIIIPNCTKNLDDAIGYGYKFSISWEDLKKGESEKRYKNIDKLKKDVKEDVQNEVDIQRDETENKTETSDNKNKPLSFYRLIYKYQINEKELPDKLIILYSYDSNVIIRSELWDENLYIVPHRTKKRPGRFDGKGYARMLAPLNDQLSKTVNLRNNSGRIACAPSFKAKIGSSFDPAVQEWMPGAIFWLDNLTDVEQMQVNTNFPELVNEEQSVIRSMQTYSGISDMSGGRESQNDPNAPGNKTIALIQEGNLLTNEDISCLQSSIEEVFYIILKLCARNLSDDDRLLKKYGLTRKDLEISLEEIVLHGIDVTFNKEIRKQQEMLFYRIYGQEPMLRQNPNSIRDMLKSNFEAWGTDKVALLPTPEEVKELMIQIQVEAMRRVEMEKIREKEALKVTEAEAVINQGGKPPPRPELQ